MDETLSGMALRAETARALGWQNVQDNANTPAGPMMCGDTRDHSEGPWRTYRTWIPRYESDAATLPEMWKWIEGNDWRWEMGEGLSAYYAEALKGENSREARDEKSPVTAVALLVVYIAEWEERKRG